MFLQLKDTLLNYKQLASVKDILFLNKINDLDDQIAQSNWKNRVKNYVRAGCLVVVVVSILLLFELYRHNKSLRQSNEALYAKNRDLIAMEHREMRERMENNSLHEQMLQSKYKGNHIDEDEGSELMSRIRTVLEMTDEVYQSNFSLAR